ncbi:MAG: hypothetical protein HN348_14935 [Proteobacteria bacterium]|nr:hypothetical protein [Pseudomonadota bacterium]
MRGVLYLVSLAVIFVVTSGAWLAFGGLMMARTDIQEHQLEGAVADLWGQPLAQEAPTVTFEWYVTVDKTETLLDGHGRAMIDQNGKPMQRHYQVQELRTKSEQLTSTDLDVDLQLDQRRKGLMWFALYNVDFNGNWSFAHEGNQTGKAWIDFAFPVRNGVYDDFHFEVDGQEMADKYQPENGRIRVPVDVAPGDKVAFRVAYLSRGQDEWKYVPSYNVGQLSDFDLAMTTDFADIYFPAYTLSPSSKEQLDGGWTLNWEFVRLVTGHGMGMVIPSPIQPGPLAASMSFSAPISLGLFLLWVYVLALIRNIEIHPINYAFLAATFFSFHLLFGYTVDHLTVELAFALSSIVSVVLMITYLRLVAGPRFALFEAGGAQLLYLVGFSLAHFWDGFTGLTVTILGIVTLFALGQLTGRIKWAERLDMSGLGIPAAKAAKAAPAP